MYSLLLFFLSIAFFFCIYRNALGHKIVGCPAYIEDPRYARNALVFNLCLVFDSAADTLKHEIVVKKLAGYLTNLEVRSGEFSA